MRTDKLEVAICDFKFKVAKCDLGRGIKVPKWYLEEAVFLISGPPATLCVAMRAGL